MDEKENLFPIEITKREGKFIKKLILEKCICCPFHNTEYCEEQHCIEYSLKEKINRLKLLFKNGI